MALSYESTRGGQKGVTASQAILKGLAVQPEDQKAYQERQFDLLADVVRNSLDMHAVYAALEGKETP